MEVLWLPVVLLLMVIYPLAAGAESLRFCALMYWPVAGLGLIAAFEGTSAVVQAVGSAVVVGYGGLVAAAVRWGY